MKIKILFPILFIWLILFNGIIFAVNEEILEEDTIPIEIIDPTPRVNICALFWPNLIFIILFFILIFILIIVLALKTGGSNKSIWIGVAIGFLIGLLGFTTIGYSYTALPLYFLLSSGPSQGFEDWGCWIVSLFLAPFVYADVGALIGFLIKLIKIKLKNKK